MFSAVGNFSKTQHFDSLSLLLVRSLQAKFKIWVQNAFMASAKLFSFYIILICCFLKPGFFFSAGIQHDHLSRVYELVQPAGAWSQRQQDQAASKNWW